MPMAPFARVDYGSRVSALRAVAVALAAPAAATPAQSSAGEFPSLIVYVNALNALNALPRYNNLDYSSFLSAVNALAAKVP